ncbi:hypothetical protein EJB05_23611, partial [Eragrostis curvula]
MANAYMRVPVEPQRVVELSMQELRWEQFCLTTMRSTNGVQGKKRREREKKDGEKKDGEKKDDAKKDGEEAKKAPPPTTEQIVAELMTQYRAYNPYMNHPVPPHYYVQSMEENPNSCVIC